MNDPKAGFIGKSVERKEDFRFLSGSGQYTDDITLPRQSYGYLRAQPARAREDPRHRHGAASKARRACSASSPARTWPVSADCPAAG